MLFSSAVFLFFFLPFVIFVYYVLLRKATNVRNIFLFIVSIGFYAWGEPVFVLVMLISITVNWFIGVSIESGKPNKDGKIWVVFAVFFNIGLLFVFKYLGFVSKNIGLLFNKDYSFLRLALPLGISFFTFRALSYVIDVYRGTRSAQRNWLNVGLYISFFPYLVAGPIVRYETISRDIDGRKETYQDFCDGTIRFIGGLAKKILIADNLAIIANETFKLPAGMAVSTAWLGVLAYTFQIFFDFSGYSDMAIGLGLMFGFHFEENFNYPYISRSITEFWRRWHISLGTWFRLYLYIPMGGSRVKRLRLIFNFFVVWTLVGIWHGANWTFVLWGLLYFLLLVTEKLLKLDKKGFSLGHVYTLLFVMIGWVLFRSDTVGVAGRYLAIMFGLSKRNVFNAQSYDYIKSFYVYIIFAFIFAVPLIRYIEKYLHKYFVWNVSKFAFLIIVFFLSVASIVSTAYNPFIYARF